MENYVLNTETVKYIGRVYNDGLNLWLTHSGSGCEFVFSGKKLDIIISCDEDSLKEDYRRNKPRIAVKADGKIIIKKVIDNKDERFTIASSETPVTALISVIKLSEAAFSLCSIRCEADGTITPSPSAQKRIEFIGDSITCGYGVDDSNMFSDFSTEAENSSKSYAYRCAQLLKTEYSLFAYSGYGVISGWTETGIRNTRELLPPYYENYGFFYKTADGIDLNSIKWDFTSLPNDVVVLNIGTNDNSYCIHHSEAYAEFEEAYTELLNTVHRCNPNAKIISAIGIIDTTMGESIHNAVTRFMSESGVNVYKFRFKSQNSNLGYGSNMHPSEDTHGYAAEELTEFIKEKHILD